MHAPRSAVVTNRVRLSAPGLFGGTMTPVRVFVAAVVAIGVAIGAAAQAQTPPGPAFRLLEATIDDIHAAFRANRLTCRALVDGYLRRIEAYDQAGPRLNAVQTVNP